MISAVIPAYNEEDNIFPAAEAISAALSGEDFELIFVDDGSTDATWERICAASGKFGARGIRFSRNFGKEPAIRAGLEESAGDAVQETFLKAYQAMDSLRVDGGEKAWLMRIAVNTCRDMRRSAWFRRIDRRVTPEDLPLASDAPGEENAELALAILRLPQKLREAVLLYY